MNILYLAHRLPYPPNKGDKLRSYHQIAHLARSHNVWCACFVDDPADLRHIAGLRAMCRDVAALRLFRSIATPRGLWSLAAGRTFTEGFYQHLRMVRVLHEWNRNIGFDAVLVFSSGMAPYAGYVDAPRKVLDFCDLDSQKWSAYSRRSGGVRSRLFSLEGRRLAHRELEWLDRFDAAVVITDAEAADLADSPLRHKLHIVGNGVELPTIRSPKAYSAEAAASAAKAGSEIRNPMVGFVGAMDYPPNVDAVCWFVQSIWPSIVSRVPDVVFQIVGRRPTRAVRRLARTRGVRVVGEVENVPEFVQRFQVSVAPIRIARGLQNKVLEAMAAAKPVVLTTSAATGIRAQDGIHCIVADDPARFADQVVTLLADAEQCERIGQAARRYVVEHHSWDREMAKLESLLAKSAISLTRP